MLARKYNVARFLTFEQPRITYCPHWSWVTVSMLGRSWSYHVRLEMAEMSAGGGVCFCWLELLEPAWLGGILWLALVRQVQVVRAFVLAFPPRQGGRAQVGRGGPGDQSSHGCRKGVGGEGAFAPSRMSQYQHAQAVFPVVVEGAAGSRLVFG